MSEQCCAAARRREAAATAARQLPLRAAAAAAGAARASALTAPRPAPPGCAARAACTKDEVDAAYAGASAAQEAWAKTPLHARCALLHKVAALMRDNKAPMAHCLVKEVAKPAKDAMSEVVRRGARRARARAGAARGGRAPAARTAKLTRALPRRQVRSADLIDYTAEEGIRILSEGAPEARAGRAARGLACSRERCRRALTATPLWARAPQASC
jgi:acyl-CoA reductase-like NAD-dependent aldehyde dehydrogenase